MNDVDMTKAVRDFLLGELMQDQDPDSIDNTTQLISTGILSSLATLQLVTFLEDTFDISVKAREVGVDNMDSIADIVAFVQSKQK